MQIIEAFKSLLSIDQIAWADGPGYLLAMIIAGSMLLISGACTTR